MNKHASLPKIKAPAAWSRRLKSLYAKHEKFLARRNPVDPEWDNGVFDRFLYPAITYRHAPIEWRYDLNPKTNPFLMERLGVNATLNPGAFFWRGKVHMVVRFEGYDRKSLFAIAESTNGIDGWLSTGAITASSTINARAKFPVRHMPSAPTPGPPHAACA